MKSYQKVTKFELKMARSFISERDKEQCQICGLKFQDNIEAVKNIDHIIPRSTVAFSHPFNLQLLCSSCNEEKGSELLDNYFEIVIANVEKTSDWFLYEVKPADDLKKNRWLLDLWETNLNHNPINFEN